MTLSVSPDRGAPTTVALVAAVLALAPAESRDFRILLDSADVASGTDDRSGVLIVSSDDGATLAAGAAHAGESVTVGYSSSADIRVDRIDVSVAGTSFDAVTGASRVAVRLSLIGERHVPAALAAIAAGRIAGVTDDAIVGALEAVTTGEPGNLERIPTRPGVVLLDDSYDSTSLSMTEALKTLAEITPVTGRSIAVLSPLAGSGEAGIDSESRDEHDRIGRIIVRLNIGLLIAIGNGARHLAGAAGLEGSWDGESVLVADPNEAYDLVRAEIREGDVILVKSGPIGTNTLGQRIGELLA